MIYAGPARYLWRLATRTLFYMFGLSLPFLLFLPYLWQDLRTLERAKRLAPLWSGL